MKMEEIRAALDTTPQETLADALAIILAEGKAPSQAVAGMDRPELGNFAQAVMYLKRNYDFDELEFFSTEADLVYVQAGDRRVLLTDRMNADHGAEGGRYEGSAFEARKHVAQAAEGSGESEGAPGSGGGRFSNLEI